jgi:quercetin dioxygenase-like cupin family protein
MKSNLKIALLLIIMTLVMACKINKNQKEMDTNKNELTEIFPKGNPLPQEWFTGKTYLHSMVAKDKNNDFSAGTVTFEPGARTKWHTHPKGQVLIVIGGSGFYQQKGKTAQVIKKGDVVNIPENTEHWHGANATKKMVHIAITNYKDDVQVTWLEPVTDEEYNGVNNQK